MSLKQAFKDKRMGLFKSVTEAVCLSTSWVTRKRRAQVAKGYKLVCRFTLASKPTQKQVRRRAMIERGWRS